MPHYQFKFKFILFHRHEHCKDYLACETWSPEKLKEQLIEGAICQLAIENNNSEINNQYKV